MTTLDRHFHMSGRYADHSTSQESIGHIAIKKAVEKLKSHIHSGHIGPMKVLDVACGPGNLTCDLLKVLETEFPGLEFQVIGLDYTSKNVEKLIENSSGEIHGLIGSFFEEGSMPDGENLIFSNEGLHWQPLYEMEQIIYSHLGRQERTYYEEWALKNLKIALQNIYNALTVGGIAVLQFGQEGQLESLWNLVKEVLEQRGFSDYIKAINFPLFYPTLSQIESLLQKVGFEDDKLQIDVFNQDLAEESPSEIAAFFRAFSEPAFRQIMDEVVLDTFYRNFERKLNSIDLSLFCKDTWKRTLITAQK